MSHSPILISRRALCAGTALGAGLAASGLAEAKKPQFSVIFHFPKGEAPVNYPLNSHDGRFPDSQYNRLNIITATHGWRLNYNTGFDNLNDAYDVPNATCSHMIALRETPLAGESAEWGSFPKGFGTQTLGGKHGSGSVFWWHTTKRHFIHDLYTFDPDGSAGLHPKGGLIKGFDGAMYGTTFEGGAHSVGTIFRITEEGVLSVLHHFDPLAGEGFRPTQPPTAGADGNYYGVTEGGGEIYSGSLYRMAPDGTLTTLYSFNPNVDGAMPHGPLTLSPDGMFYGMTAFGGKHNGGTIFSLSHAGVFTVLHSFNLHDGFEPTGSLCALPDGTLYGSCSKGGAFNRGSVFKFHPAERRLVTRHDFAADGSEGATPMAGFCLASNGYLYSTARDGGAHSGGTLFRIAP